METLEREAQYFFHTYKRIPLDIEYGEGVYLFGKDGRRYLDMFAGLAVNALGYGHPKIIKAIEDQIRKYIHVSNYYLQEPQIQLAELLVALSGYKKAFFTNSGTEAIEGALKIARKWGSRHGKSNIVSFTNAFHGRTMGALSLMDRPKYRDGFEPFLDRCTIVGYNNIDALENTVDEKTSAVVLEFIQGEGGIIPATPPFVDAIQRLKNKFNFLIVADEIQSGLGRTGKLFGYQHHKIEPDIVVIAKPLGGGLPLGAILGNDAVADVLEPGSHGTTFGGNPVACAAGIATLKEIMDSSLISNAERMGLFLQENLVGLKAQFPAIITDVRGKGLMIGMELTCDGAPIVFAMRDRGLLLNCTNRTVLRFLPPLIIQESEIQETVAVLRSIMGNI